MCQYEFRSRIFTSSRIQEAIFDLYFYHDDYNPINFTCYEHLKCDHGPLTACLDLSEICNGKIDCRDGGLDEEHCWQLEINEYEENEYPCKNGQCILQLNPEDNTGYGCLDDWNLQLNSPMYPRYCSTQEIPSIICEDLRCHTEGFTSFCLIDRIQLLKNIIFSDQVLSVNSNCSLAFQHAFI